MERENGAQKHLQKTKMKPEMKSKERPPERLKERRREWPTRKAKRSAKGKAEGKAKAATDGPHAGGVQVTAKDDATSEASAAGGTPTLRPLCLWLKRRPAGVTVADRHAEWRAMCPEDIQFANTC